MNTPVDMTAILSKKAEDVKPPSLLPPGGYIARVVDYDTSRPAQSGTAAVRFNILIEHAIDVDPQALSDSGAEFPIKFEHAFYLTEQSLYRFKEFLEKDLLIVANGRELGEMVLEAPGKIFRLTGIHRPGQGQNAGKFFFNISETNPPN